MTLTRKTAAALAAGCLIIGLAAGALGAVLALRVGGVDTTDRQAMVRDALMADPEIIRDAFVALQEREQAAQDEQRRQALAEASEEVFRSSADFVAGNPEGDVTLVEFFDYNCGYCRAAMADMNKLIETDPDLRFVLKEFPILSEGSVEAARISVAVHRLAPEKYLEFHRTLLSSRGQVDGARALAVAEDLGLDVKALKAEAAKPEVDEVLGDSQRLAVRLGVNGTPGYVVGDEVIPGAIGYEGLAEKVAEARADGAQASN
ncbi:MAG TPA: DsbA family protein [Hyphomicrobiales bacterium]|nr:DsbA family protein [Hyphomicrobiales bacterium]